MSELASRNKLSYIPSLDGIRGLFCVLITLNHWPLMIPFVPFGFELLQSFFLMSGFLIGRILIYDTAKFDSFGGYIRKFYARRTLRIFPLYFFYLFLCLGLRFALPHVDVIRTGTQDLVNNWEFHFTYTANLTTLFHPEGTESTFLTHLWSLCLEEQFYLFMPFLIFFLRGKALKIATVVLILLPFITRPLGYYLLANIHDSEIWAGLLIYQNLIFQSDAFALGLAIALFKFEWLKHPKRWFYIILVIYIGVLFHNYRYFGDFLVQLSEFMNLPIPEEMAEFFYLRLLGLSSLLPMAKQHYYVMPMANILSALLILTAVRGNPIGKRFFESALMVDFGKVTYGMYVYHFALMMIYIKILQGFLGANIFTTRLWLHIPLYLLYVLILYIVGKLSFKYIESPFLKLKNKIK